MNMFFYLVVNELRKLYHKESYPQQAKRRQQCVSFFRSGSPPSNSVAFHERKAHLEHVVWVHDRFGELFATASSCAIAVVVECGTQLTMRTHWKGMRVEWVIHTEPYPI